MKYELQRIRSILSAVTGLEDDDQEYIEDARRAVDALIERATAHTETLKLALEALEHGLVNTTPVLNYDGRIIGNAITAIKQALDQREKPKCNPHPKAPHGFMRDASHTANRYVCECEGWDAYDAGYQAGIDDTYKRMDALDKKAENARELGLDYGGVQGDMTNIGTLGMPVNITVTPAAPVQSCYCPNCEALSKELVEIKTQRQWVGLTDEEAKKEFSNHNCDISKDLAGILARGIERKLKEKNK